MGITESIPTVRFVPSTGDAPIEANAWPSHEPATAGLPNSLAITPMKTGELMSPKMWIRKMLTA